MLLAGLLAGSTPAAARAPTARSVSAGGDEGGIEAREQHAREHFEAGRFLEAAREWKALFQDRRVTLPARSRAELARRIALAFARAGQDDDAWTFIRWAGKADPKNPRIRSLHRSLERRRAGTAGRTGAARAGGAAARPADPAAAFAQGQELFETGRLYSVQDSPEAGRLFTRAIAEFQQALDLGHREAEAHYYIGSAYLQRGVDGDLDRARTHLETSRNLDDIEVRTFVDLGEVYGLLGKAPEELASYEKALSLDPDCEDCHFRMALIHDDSDAPDAPGRIVEHARRAIELNPGFKEPLVASIHHPDAGRQIAAIPVPEPEPEPEPSPPVQARSDGGGDDGGASGQGASDAPEDRLDQARALAESNPEAQQLLQKSGKSLDDLKKDRRVKRYMEDPKYRERIDKMVDRFLSRRKKKK